MGVLAIMGILANMSILAYPGASYGYPGVDPGLSLVCPVIVGPGPREYDLVGIGGVWQGLVRALARRGARPGKQDAPKRRTAGRRRAPAQRFAVLGSGVRGKDHGAILAVSGDPMGKDHGAFM